MLGGLTWKLFFVYWGYALMGFGINLIVECDITKGNPTVLTVLRSSIGLIGGWIIGEDY